MVTIGINTNEGWFCVPLFQAPECCPGHFFSFLFNVEFQKNFAGSFLVQWMDEQQPDLGDVLEEELLKMAKSFPDSDLWQEAGE